MSTIQMIREVTQVWGNDLVVVERNKGFTLYAELVKDTDEVFFILSRRGRVVCTGAQRHFWTFVRLMV